LNYGTSSTAQKYNQKPGFTSKSKNLALGGGSCNNAITIFVKVFIISQLNLEDGRRKKENGSWQLAVGKI
jgi:hypothetical protein